MSHASGYDAVPDMSRKGDDSREDRFTRLYLESYPLVYNYVRFRMADEFLAEDIVSEAYLLAARSFDQFDATRAKFSTWVVKIATNCMRGYWRRKKPTIALDDVPEADFAVASEEGTVDDQDMVNQLLSVLGEQERELVVMKYREGMRNVDIAQELDMNASTVATKLAKALDKMRAVSAKWPHVS